MFILSTFYNIFYHILPRFYLICMTVSHWPCLRNSVTQMCINPLTPELHLSAQRCLPRFLLGILIFKGFTARSLYKSFGVKVLILTSLFPFFGIILLHFVPLCVGHLPEDGWSVLPKHVVVYKKDYCTISVWLCFVG
jgi:hypothetical protein